MQLSEYETRLVDEVAMEIFVRRIFNVRDMSATEMETSAANCYNKALCFLEARRGLMSNLNKETDIPF